MSRVPSRRTIANLPQTSETWQIAVAKLRTWIVSADGRPTRPSAIFVFDPYEGIIIYTELVEPARIPDGVADVLLKGMRKPLPGGGSPRRPAPGQFICRKNGKCNSSKASRECPVVTKSGGEPRALRTICATCFG